MCRPAYPGRVLLPLHGVPLHDVGGLPRFTFGRMFTLWELEPFPVTITLVLLGLYAWGVATMERRGDRWPVGRSLAWFAAVLVFFFATCSGLAAYDTTLLSAHMGQHMLLSMLVPMLMALGAPVTLALRTLPLPARKVLLAAVHSWVVKVLTFPALAFALYVLSPWLLYFTGWYEASLRSDYVHQMMHVHLVVVGSLFFWPLLGVDPIPGRLAYPFRMLMLVLTLPFHAFLGVTIMNQQTLIAGDWYTRLGEAWLPDPMHDQHIAGGLLWGSGDIVGLSIFAAVFVQWVRSSMREAEREDRRLDLLEARAARTSAETTIVTDRVQS